MLSYFRWYRRMRGGRWGRVGGWFWGWRYVRVTDACRERIHEDWRKSATEIHCPVCGFYCLGRGGLGCIDKPALMANEKGAGGNQSAMEPAQTTSASEAQ